MRYEQTLTSQCQCVAEVAVAALLFHSRALGLLPSSWDFKGRLRWLWLHSGPSASHLCTGWFAQNGLPLVLHSWNTPSLLMFITSPQHDKLFNWKKISLILTFYSKKTFNSNIFLSNFKTTYIKRKIVSLQSLRIPIARHFCRRQYWQRFLWCFVTSQDLLPLHWYPSCLRMLRLKKPLHPSQLTAP